MNTVYKQLALALAFIFCVGLVYFVVYPQLVSAVNIKEFKDTISDSGPSEFANHTLDFILKVGLSPGSTIEVTPPNGFSIPATPTFGARNVELLVDGIPRTSSTTVSPGVDMVEITTGTPGFIRYTLAPDFSIPVDSRLELKIGNQTSGALPSLTTYSTSTGTTTTPADTEPIRNSSTLGMHHVNVKMYDGSLVASGNFVVFLNEKVTVPGVDTTEEIPPERFNGAPTSTIGGSTLSVEISLETNELAFCRYSTTPGVSYGSMTNTFSNTGFLFQSHIVPAINGQLNEYYVRCMDDEGNFNIDDYLIAFVVNDIPTGIPNATGSTSGDGTGSGDEGTGSGEGTGGETGSSDGNAPVSGESSGTGGGGGGGGKGSNSGDTSGGGFELEDAPYRSGDGRVIISGYAYPNSTVSILVDGNFFTTVKANNTGVYSITLDAIAKGVYTFGVFAEGSNKVKSSTFSTSFTVSGARTSALGNINVSPSILVSPNPVNPGETLTVSGYTLPNATVTIQNSRNNTNIPKEHSATSDSSGKWSTTIDTSGFSIDTYQIRAKSAQTGGASTQYSEYTFYGVGKSADVPLNADLNRDTKVNLIDFSILLYWWNTAGGDSNPPADINRDGKVSLTDFSILLFNWTG